MVRRFAVRSKNVLDRAVQNLQRYQRVHQRFRQLQRQRDLRQHTRIIQLYLQGGLEWQRPLPTSAIEFLIRLPVAIIVKSVASLGRWRNGDAKRQIA